MGYTHTYQFPKVGNIPMVKSIKSTNVSGTLKNSVVNLYMAHAINSFIEFNMGNNPDGVCMDSLVSPHCPIFIFSVLFGFVYLGCARHLRNECGIVH